MNKLLAVIGCSLLVACSAQRSAQKEIGGDDKIAKAAETLLFKDSTIANAHIGISIYDADAGKYLYNYQGNKYFVPASNVKIFSCYTALKYLGDSVPGLQHIKLGDTIYLVPTGDPTLLHKDYSSQPVFDFLKKQTQPMVLVGDVWNDAALGFGWTWDDYNSSYMAERSPLPVYGNVIRFIQTESDEGPVV
ncbi:MAG TPA: D-alanyl-D-alanine carboxypeptidase, partial [Chitinophagaceae bacterium]